MVVCLVVKCFLSYDTEEFGNDVKTIAFAGLIPEYFPL
jgi:hypothetical protein